MEFSEIHISCRHPNPADQAVFQSLSDGSEEDLPLVTGSIQIINYSGRISECGTKAQLMSLALPPVLSFRLPSGRLIIEPIRHTRWYPAAADVFPTTFC